MMNQSEKEGNAPVYDVKSLISDAIEPERWIKHLKDDLMKFWGTDDATQMENGLFKTYRTNEGKPLSPNPAEWPPEFIAAAKDPDAKGLVEPEYNFIRAHSRQTYAYGIAFHMTGDAKYLELCRKGALALVDAMDGNDGMYTKNKISNNTWDIDYDKRNSQDLAYGVTGLGMYYFLTHDPGILHKIIQVKDYIFKFYFDEARGYITWYPKHKKEYDIQIVAQLDQLYAYMLMLTPTLPEPYKTEWTKDLKCIANVLIELFYSEKYEIFWGLGGSSRTYLGAPHTDFGHSVKTFWVILKIGEILQEPFYIDFARQRIDKILKNAYIKETGSWAKKFDEEGKLDTDKEWWILAELDQACEILSLNDPAYLTYLNNTQKYWLEYMVDKQYGEIWHLVSSKDNKPLIQYPKVHSWKTSLHSFEHVLFSYMVSSKIKNKDFKLYYALPECEDINNKTVAPYMFRGNIIHYEISETVCEVTYNSLH